ncbi:MAG: DUF6350 family protein [Nocardioidaceae bacterium]
MTGLTVPPQPRLSPARLRADESGRRPVVLAAILAALAAAGGVLLTCMAVALAAWFALDQGTHGTTTEAIRLGSDAWLLAHGSGIDLGTVTATMIPLGLTGLCAYICFRLARWAGATSAREDLTATLLAVGAFAASYAVVALVAAVLADSPGAQPSIARAFGGALVLAALSGGPGLLAGTGDLAALVDRVPRVVRSVALTGAVAALGVVTVGAFLVAVTMLLDLNAGATVLSQLHGGATAGALMTLLTALLAPNAALFGASYLAGPGFAVGTGTSVSVASATIGPVPAFPLLVALPSDGAAPAWALAFLLAPVLVGALAGSTQARRYPELSYAVTAVHALLGAVVAAVLLAIGWELSGGVVGPGRMTDIGPFVFESSPAVMVALGLGGASGAMLTRWRRGEPEPETDPATEPTVAVIPEQPVDGPVVDGPVVDGPVVEGATDDGAADDEPTVVV